MGLFSIILGFCGAPWVVGATSIVTKFHPNSDGPDNQPRELHIMRIVKQDRFKNLGELFLFFYL